MIKDWIYIAAAVGLFYSSSALAFCDHRAHSKTRIIDFGSSLTDRLSIPEDASIGSVIYQDTVHISTSLLISCTSSELVGFVLNPKLGSTLSGNTFPLGQTGLSFRIYTTSDTQAGYIRVPTIVPEDSAASNHLWMAGYYRLEIIKSGELSSQNKVPSGYLGKHSYGAADLATFNLLNPITLSLASCQTPAVSVQMGDDYRLEEFTKSGDTPRLIKFDIGLNQCQSGISKVTYSLKANTQVIDQKKGIVALNSSSTAKGIGLKLMGEAGQPIALDTTYPFNGFNATGTSFNIPLSATYYRLADSRLEPGTANASVTFIVNYL